MVADITSGNTDLADVAFLVALILGVLAGVLAIPRADPPSSSWSAFVGWLAVAALGLGLLVL